MYSVDYNYIYIGCGNNYIQHSITFSGGRFAEPNPLKVNFFMDNFFNHTCRKCGGIDEAKFTQSGPHVKQLCLHCGCYVKFFDKSVLPDISDIRMKIWIVSGKNANLINSAKESVSFHEYSDTVKYSNTWTKLVLQKLQWWKVYLKVRSLVPSS